MASYNKVILAGNLTRDPELSYTPSNTAICKFGLATNRQWTDRQTNERREEVCFVDCTAFGRQAEVINQYMNKGKPILLDGRLQFSQWTGQDGQKRSKLEVVVESFQFLGGRPEGGGSGGNQATSPQGAPVSDGGYDAGSRGSGGPDDVPF